MMISSSFDSGRERAQSDMQHLITLAMQFNLANQPKHPHARACLQPSHYIDQYQTVSIDVARQTGKTTAIAHMYTNNDLVICPNESMMWHTRMLVERTYRMDKDVSRIITADNLQYWYRNRHPAETVVDRIFVDDCRLTHQEKDMMHYIFYQFGANQIVHLGHK